MLHTWPEFRDRFGWPARDEDGDMILVIHAIGALRHTHLHDLTERLPEVGGVLITDDNHDIARRASRAPEIVDRDC